MGDDGAEKDFNPAPAVEQLTNWKDEFNGRLQHIQEEILLYLTQKHISNEELALLIRNTISELKISVSELLNTMSQLIRKFIKRSKRLVQNSNQYWQQVVLDLNNQLEHVTRTRAIEADKRKELEKENRRLKQELRHIKMEHANPKEDYERMLIKLQQQEQERNSSSGDLTQGAPMRLGASPRVGRSPPARGRRSPAARTAITKPQRGTPKQSAQERVMVSRNMSNSPPQLNAPKSSAAKPKRKKPAKQTDVPPPAPSVESHTSQAASGENVGSSRPSQESSRSPARSTTSSTSGAKSQTQKKISASETTSAGSVETKDIRERREARRAKLEKNRVSRDAAGNVTQGAQQQPDNKSETDSKSSIQSRKEKIRSRLHDRHSTEKKGGSDSGSVSRDAASSDSSSTQQKDTGSSSGATESADERRARIRARLRKKRSET